MTVKRQPAEGTTLGVPYAAVILIFCAVSAALLEARSNDFWWHLETGEQIVAQGAIPRIDDFTFTSKGRPWVDHEWLFQLLLHAVWISMGVTGLTILKSVAALTILLAGFFSMRRAGCPDAMALAIPPLCLIGARFRLAERPEIVTLGIAAVVAAILLDLAMRPGAPTRRWLWLGLLSVLWVNMHAGALVAPVLSAAAAVGATVMHAIDRRREESEEKRRPMVLWVAALVTGVALMINPWGAGIYRIPLAIGRALSRENLINPEWVRPSLTDFPIVHILVVGGALAMVLAARFRRPGTETGAALFVIVASLAMTSVRHVGVLFAVLPVALGAVSISGWRPKIPVVVGIATGALSALWMLLAPPAPTVVGIGIQGGRFPDSATTFIDEHLTDARLYNDVRFGRYLIWRGYPQRRVFIDGRNEVHAELLAELSSSLDDGRRWQAMLSAHDVEGAILYYRPTPVRLQNGSLSSFSETHFPGRLWALVYWDDTAMVFIRRDGRFAPLAADAYETVRPEAWRLGLIETEHPVTDPRLYEEILRKIAFDPQCELAKEMASVYGIKAANHR